MQNSEDVAEIYVRLDYSVNDGINIMTDSIATKI